MLDSQNLVAWNTWPNSVIVFIHLVTVIFISYSFLILSILIRQLRVTPNLDLSVSFWKTRFFLQSPFRLHISLAYIAKGEKTFIKCSYLDNIRYIVSVWYPPFHFTKSLLNLSVCFHLLLFQVTTDRKNVNAFMFSATSSIVIISGLGEIIFLLFPFFCRFFLFFCRYLKHCKDQLHIFSLFTHTHVRVCAWKWTLMSTLTGDTLFHH